MLSSLAATTPISVTDLPCRGPDPAPNSVDRMPADPTRSLNGPEKPLQRNFLYSGTVWTFVVEWLSWCRQCCACARLVPRAADSVKEIVCDYRKTAH